MGAATRYLQQRYSMPYAQVKGMLTDIGTEELAHIEMVSAIIYQLTRCMTPEEIKRSGFDTYFVDQSTDILIYQFPRHEDRHPKTPICRHLFRQHGRFGRSNNVCRVTAAWPAGIGHPRKGKFSPIRQKVPTEIIRGDPLIYAK